MTVDLAVLFAGITIVAVVWIVTRRPQPTPPPRTPSVLDERLLESVIVTLKSGTTFAGVLYAEDSGAVVLCKAEQVERDGRKIPADGEVVVLRGDIDFIQRP